MKLNVNTVITNLDGSPLWAKAPQLDPKDPDKVIVEGTPMLLADVLINAALEPPAPGPNAKGYTKEQHIARYELALAAEKAKKLDPAVVDIKASFAAELQDDIRRLYKTLVAGQVIPMLDGE